MANTITGGAASFGPLHPEHKTILKLLGAGHGFSQIRRHLYLFEDSETRASVTGSMIGELFTGGYAELIDGRACLTDKGRAAVA